MLFHIVNESLIYFYKILLVDPSVVLDFSGMRRLENVQVLEVFLKQLMLVKVIKMCLFKIITINAYMHTACKDGFFGVNCSTKCPVMYFGPSCGFMCSCSIDQCHHITGCQQSPLRGRYFLYFNCN